MSLSGLPETRGGEGKTLAEAEFRRTSLLAKWPDEARTARAPPIIVPRLPVVFLPATPTASLLRAECWSSPAVAMIPLVRATHLHVTELGDY